jgi:PAS domain S-box-containing protein
MVARKVDSLSGGWFTLKSTRLSTISQKEAPANGKAANARSAAGGAQPDANIAGRLRFESFLLELSAFFAKAPTDCVERGVDLWLERLAQFIGVDRISLWECDTSAGQMHLRHVFCVPDFPKASTSIATAALPWLIEEFRHGRIVSCGRIPEDIPATASAEREYMKQLGVKSALAVPVEAGTTIYVVTFMSIRGHRKWPENLVRRLHLVAEIFATALGRLRAERSLSTSESRTRAILKAFPDLIFVLNRDGVFIESHCESYTDLLMPPEEFTGRVMEDVLPPEMTRLFRAAFERAGKTHDVVEVDYLLPVKGDQRHFEARLVRRDDGAMVVVVRNVTEKHRAASKLRDSEQQFRVAFTHSAVGMALVSLDGDFLQVNATLCQMLGYSQSELLSTKFQPLTAPEDLALDLGYVCKAISGEISHYEIEKRYLHKDGRIVWALLSAALVRDTSDKPLYFVSQVHDISERRQAQMEIDRARLELAHMSRVSLVGQLTATLAHELAQPITAITINAAAGVQATELEAPSETRALFQDILDSGRRAGNVVKNVMGMLKKDNPPHTRVDLNRLIQEMVHVMRSDLLGHHVNLTMNLDAANTEMNANPVELQQVLLNLMLNATEAMGSIPVSERNLVITTAVHSDTVELIVQDSGVGAPAEDMKRIFEPFVTTKATGVGVGLSICAQIVSAHKGKLSAENNRDRGMTFRCILPR